MATTVAESFKQYATNLNITDRQEKIVSNCRRNVVEKLGAKLHLNNDQSSRLIGSYDRDTLTRYLKERDVDVMVVLHYGQHKDWDQQGGASKALNRFKSILSEAYPSTECNIDRNCVTMQLTEFRLDVVPAFWNNGGYYQIPDTYRDAWLKTNPVAFSEEVTRINKVMGGDFVPLIKMVKGWNREFKNKLRGFHVESIMLNRYASYTQTYTVPSMLRVFFSALPSYLQNPTTDPVTGDRVDLYLDNESLGNRRSDLVKRAEKAAALAEEAYQDIEKYPSVSIGEWKELLGEFFPAYG